MYLIFWYELKRLIFNKLFLALLIISCLYSFLILSRETIMGIAFTAPFSPWSFGYYLAKVLPLLMVTLLFFVTFMYSNHEKLVRQLTFAAPINPFMLCLVKCFGIMAGFLAITLFVVLQCMIFFVVLFRFTNFGNFIIPFVITIIPCLLFFLGAGLLLGGLEVNILYVLMIAALLLGFLRGSLPLPAFFDLYGSRFFSTHPLSLPLDLNGEGPFLLPVSFIFGRVFFSGVGAFMAFLGIKRYK